MYANVRSLDIVAGHQEKQLALKAEQKASSCSSQTQLFRREEADRTTKINVPLGNMIPRIVRLTKTNVPPEMGPLV